MKAQINVEFNESPNRQELQSGEEIKTLFGKIKKWLTDLKPVAFSGSYNDLTDTPDAAINANAENIARLQSEIIRADDADSEGKCQLYKTVNGERVDVEPKVSGGSPYIYMTQAEYEALDTYQPGKMYWVTYPVTGCYLVWKDGVCIDGDGKDRIGGIKYTDSGKYTHYWKCPYRNLAIAFNPCNDGDSEVTVYDYLENLDIAKNVTNIGKYAFYKSPNLKKIKMTNVSSIGDYAFQDCSVLTNADLGDSVTSIGTYAFSGCSSLVSITIPDSVTSIGTYAFISCSSLSSVSLPIGAGITFGHDVFHSCTNFKSIIFLSSPNNNSITSSDIAYFKENYPKCIVNVSLPDGLLSIGDSAFNSCYSLTSIKIPDSVTSIGNSAFYSCSSLTSITIPDSVTSIGSRAFDGCKSLVSVTIPDSVTSIGSETFSGCSSLASITIPDSVTSIGSSAFYNCKTPTNVYISDIESWCNIQFDGYSSNPLNCGGNLYINNDLATEIIIPNSITSIGNYAFYNCKSLASITIPDSVTSIGRNAFNYCSSLISIIIPDGVTSIGNTMFYYCTSLKNITIPDSVTSIGERAFLSCYVLSDIYYTGTQSQWNAITKGDSWNNGMGSSVSGGTKIHYNYVPE